MFFQRVLGIALVCASPFLMAEDCEYSEWGRDDQIGAANRITPEPVSYTHLTLPTTP